MHAQISVEAHPPERKKPTGRSPVLLLLSFVVPVGIIAGGMVALKGIDVWSALGGLLGIVSTAAVIGALLAIGAILRKEGWRAGAYLSLLLNVLLLVWLHR
jgi:hypothetical protein